MMHQPLPANCAMNVDPGLPPGYVPQCPAANGKRADCKNITHGPGGVSMFSKFSSRSGEEDSRVSEEGSRSLSVLLLLRLLCQSG